MQKGRYRLHDPQSRVVDALSRPQTAFRVLLIAAGLTAVVTVASLSELSGLIAQANPDALDWRQVAGRAVKHAESLPHLHHQQRAGSASGADGAAGNVGATASSGSSSSTGSGASTSTGSSTTSSGGADAGTGATVVSGGGATSAGGGVAAPQLAQTTTSAVFSAASAPADVGGGGAAGGGAAAAAAPAGAAEEEEAAAAAAPAAPEECHVQENTELWGDVVKWGASFKVDTAGECCDACLQALQPEAGKEHGCNVWVWCGDSELCKGQHRECWLKYLLRPAATKPAREGPDVGWTSGIVGPDAPAPTSDAAAASEAADAPSGPARKFHVVTSAQGSAVHWQVRVHYYWYLKQKHRCETELAERCEMGGFTRLLHSGSPDDLMDEVPTFVASPLPDSVVKHDWYPVLNRPWAFAQWVKQANISEDYVLMSEPDHIFLRPLPNFMRGDAPAAFPFFYIEPHKEENLPEVRKFVPGGSLTRQQAEEIAPIGNSPTFLSLKQMKEVMPLWTNVSIAIFKDPSASEKWGWVQEMYAFTISLWRVGVKKVDLVLHFMAQPPWDSKMQLSPGKPYYICHYTYGNDFDLAGTFTPGKYGRWRFDKRTYATRPPPRHLGDPPKGMKNDMVRTLVNSINEATANIPCWDEYARTGKRPATCGEKLPPQADGFSYPAYRDAAA